MSMNIKNPEAHRLARQLADLTGESMATAVTVALRERRDRVLAHDGRTAERILALGRDCANRLSGEATRIEHGDLLYGHDGLPR